jgi:hypothetical protein
MTTETIMDNEFITMWYHHDTKILHHQIHKYVFGENFRSALETGVATLVKYGADKWLSDDQSYAALQKEDMDWGRNVWSPKALKAGWKHWAIVLPKSIIGQMSHRRLLDGYVNTELNVNVFGNVAEGMAWLEKQ